jgi:hypothetical protein
VQAVGRVRGVNRTAANPVEVYVILNDTVVPSLPVDRVVEFGDLEPDAIDKMIARGLVPEWPGDAAKLYPDLFPSRPAAKMAYLRAGLSVGWKSQTGAELVTSPYRTILIRGCYQFAVKYRTPGRGSKPRLALVDPVKVPDAKAALKVALGRLALFEVLPEPVAAAA